MAAAGWYVDPQYDGWERYFDGKNWTDHRRPTQTPSWPAPPPRRREAAAVETEPDRNAVWRPPAVESEEPEEPPWWEPPATPEPAAMDLPPIDTPTEIFGAPGQTGAQRNGQSRPASDLTATDAPSDDPDGGAVVTDKSPDVIAWQPHRSRPRRPLALAAIAVVVVLLAAAAVVLIRQLSHPLTFEGQPIANPAQVLAQAGANVRTIVGRRHGVDSSSTRCYFVRPAHRAQGAPKTDVASTLLCGPVLFVDGTIGHEYLRFTLHSRRASDSRLTLFASHAPVSSQPSALPQGDVLTRPDGRRPPSGIGGLSVPAPPAAPPNELTSAPVGSQPVPVAPSDAVIGSLHGGLRLMALGTVARYGRFDNARSAPLGQKLIAFRLGTFTDNNGADKSLIGSTTVTVNGGAGRHLPPLTATFYVVAVPASATSVNLVVTDGGYTQTLSLLTGQPGPHNLTVLTRDNRVVSLHETKPVTFKFTPAIIGAHHKPQTSDVISLTVNSASLSFWAGPSNRPASSPSSAWLVADASYTDPDHPGQVFGLPSSVMTFTPHGGSPEPASNLASTTGKSLNGFSVPASITSGTLTISGSFSQPAANGHKTIKTTIATPVSFTVTFSP